VASEVSEVSEVSKAKVFIVSKESTVVATVVVVVVVTPLVVTPSVVAPITTMVMAGGLRDRDDGLSRRCRSRPPCRQQRGADDKQARDEQEQKLSHVNLPMRLMTRSLPRVYCV
jgi:hypothetical protein